MAARSVYLPCWRAEAGGRAKVRTQVRTGVWRWQVRQHWAGVAACLVSQALGRLDYSLLVGANFITSNSLKFRNPASSSVQITRNGTIGSYRLGDVMVISWFWMWR